MKKNFLKKLASVLSLALVVSAITPAASASAAAAPNLAKRYTNVYEGKSYAYTVKNAAGHTVKWTVSGAGAEYVNLSAKTGSKTTLTIDTDGEAAAKNKNVTVKANFYKGGKLVKGAGDVVKLKVSATGLGIVAADSDVDLDAIPAGEVVDFNRTITPSNATSVTYWSVTDKDGNATEDATIDGTGNFKADKVGEYTIKAVARNAKNGVDIQTATQDVKVGIAIASAVQTTDKAVKATFNVSVKDIAKATNFSIVAKDAVASVVPVKDISISDDGKEVTVNTFIAFKDGVDYTLTYTNGNDKSEKDFSATIGKVVAIEITPVTVPVGIETEVKVALKNAAGVDITGTISSGAYGTSVEVEDGYYDEGSKKLVIIEKGKTAKVTATLYATEYSTTGQPLDELKQEQVITGVDPTAITIGAYSKYTISTESSYAKIDWKKDTNNKISTSDPTSYIHVEKIKDSADVEFDTTTGLTYSSSNENVLLVNGNVVTPLKEGTAYIIAKNDDKKIEWTFLVQVVGDRKATSISADKPSVTVSNVPDATDTATVKITVKDQFGADMDITSATIDKVLAAPKDAVKWLEGETLAVDENKVTFAGSDVLKGTYRLLVKVGTSNGEQSVVITVNVLEPATNGAFTYALLLDSKEVDTTLKADTDKLAKVNAKVAQYKGGVLNNYVAIKSIDVYQSDNKNVASGTAIAGTAGTATTGFDIDAVKSEAGVLTKLATGTYRVVVKADVVVGDKTSERTFTQYFKVVDNQEGPTVTVKSLTTSGTVGTVADLVADVLEIKDGDVSYTAKTITTKPANVNSISTGDKVYIEKVGVELTIDALGTYVYEINVGKTFTNK